MIKSDAGWYTVSAINEAGMSTCNARLDVASKYTYSIYFSHFMFWDLFERLWVKIILLRLKSETFLLRCIALALYNIFIDKVKICIDVNSVKDV